MRDSVSDGSEHLLNLVGGLDVSDSDLVDQRRSALELGVVNAVRSELSSESRIGPSEVRGGSGLLVLGRDSVDELQSVPLREGH